MEDDEPEVWPELVGQIDVPAWQTAQEVLRIAFDECDAHPIERPRKAAEAQQRRMTAIETANEWLGKLEDGAGDWSSEYVLAQHRKWVHRAHATAPKDLRPVIARVLPGWG